MYGVFHLRRKKKKGRENGFPEFGEIPKVQFCFRLFKLFHLLRTLNSWASTSFQAFKWFFVHLNCLHQHRTELILVANYLCHIKYAKSIRSTFDSRFTQVNGHARAQALILSVCIAISSRNLHVTIQTQCAVHKNVTAFVGYISIPFLDQTKYKDISFLLLTTRFVHLQFSLKV